MVTVHGTCQPRFSLRSTGASGHTRSVTSALLSEALAPLRANPERTAILLDIDGTLAPIVDNAADAHVPETTRQLLIAVANRYGLMACVSGRRASEARAMVSIGAISYIGSHGAELLRAGWTEAVLDKGVEEWVRRIHEFGREADTADVRKRRVRLEDKGAIVAFHWRGAQDEEGARDPPSPGRRRGPGRPACGLIGDERSSRPARRSRSTRAPGSSASCAWPATGSTRPYTWATTPPTSTPSAPCASSSTRAGSNERSGSASHPLKGRRR